MISVTSTKLSEYSTISVNGRIIEVNDPYTIYVIEPVENGFQPPIRRENTAVDEGEDVKDLSDLERSRSMEDRLRRFSKVVLFAFVVIIIARVVW
jgi:hypothetical protein